jgi:hypothetical protein
MDFATFLQISDTALRFATPLLLACLAGLFSERAGIFDIGLEGKMLMAAMSAGSPATAQSGRFSEPATPLHQDHVRPEHQRLAHLQPVRREGGAHDALGENGGVHEVGAVTWTGRHKTRATPLAFGDALANGPRAARGQRGDQHSPHFHNKDEANP